ncbi:T9SS type A sorting domain-containing protein [Polaribacter cellanae]|uniref:T9SS type A sorting domain-containing protein n=1 Tax=Polaribacter cellanae TaxID=2818493 RepID=A0A975CQN3_9FLAO|nr:T9SS type A sorting domain-containing protein [Polaribacter cellanae]QTE24351.1 T9SS type A sorting domain-containing protein [Polaribacter cellanae]
MTRKYYIFTLITVGVILTISILKNKETDLEKNHREYTEYIQNHPYAKRTSLNRKELKSIAKKDRPDLAFEQDFLRTVDPKTKKLHQDRLVSAINYSKKRNKNNFLKKSTNSTLNWSSRGPKTVSGRVRALMFDPNDATDKRVFAGGVSGGIWKNNDITNENSPWEQVNPEMSNFAISAMAYDPVQTNTFYIGTGEGWGNSDAVNGAGIWKSTDGGVTWNNLATTVDFEQVFDIVVRNEGGATGVIYAAMRDLDGINSSGTDVFRSVDGGATWTVSLDDPIRDLELAADGTIWAGNATGSILSSSDGVTWVSKYTSSLNSPGRVELSTAKSSTKIVYALITAEVPNSNNTGKVSGLGEIVKTENAGTTWSNLPEPADSGDATIPDKDFTRGQAWYDLIISVDPTDSKKLYVGGVNTFKSNDGGTTWIKTSSWESYYDNSVSIVHADIHNIIFRPNKNELLVATDGGIFYSPNNSLTQTTTGFVPRNLNFNITQFYSGAIDPVNENGFLGGAQDNGTSYFNEPNISSTSELLGGDGGFCFIDQTATNSVRGIYYLASTQNNVTYLYDYSNGSPKYTSLINNDKSGSFINASDYDDVNNIFYSYDSPNIITRATLKADYENQGDDQKFLGVTDSIQSNLFNGAVATHIRVSPHNNNQRQVFFGTSFGKIVKFDSQNETFSNVSTPVGVNGSVSCIEFGATDNEILLTYSNYGILSVWYTVDGGANWTNVEGNLPDIPVRWALFNPLNRKEVILATEVGVWKTKNIKKAPASSIVWEPASTNMGNVRVDMLQYRASDNLILAATHGRGMFTSNFTAAPASINDVLAKTKAFTIYPTISNGNFTLFAKNSLGKSKVRVFDISGKQVYKTNLDFTSQEKQEISVNLNAGIYIVNVVDENNKKSSNKIIIE